jgi:hypothetical protein
MSFANRRLFAIVTHPKTKYSTAFSANRYLSRSIATMANKASLKPAEDFIEFVNASPTRKSFLVGESRNEG